MQLHSTAVVAVCEHARHGDILTVRLHRWPPPGLRRSGAVAASAARYHTVTVDVGDLTPNTRYYYRFRAGDLESVTGITKTAASGQLDEMLVGVVSCANWGERGVAGRQWPPALRMPPAPQPSAVCPESLRAQLPSSCRSLELLAAASHLPTAYHTAPAFFRLRSLQCI